MTGSRPAITRIWRVPGAMSQDLSNLKRRRFDIGENTGHFVYSADLHLELPGLEIAGEYARSSVYSRYPAEIDNSPAFDDAPRFADRGSAYFLNAVHNFERGLVGGELFSINPEFSTEFRSYLHWESPLLVRPSLRVCSTITCTGRRWTITTMGITLPTSITVLCWAYNTTHVGTDVDGVFLDQDEDHDGIPDTNRDLDRIPDYDEPFPDVRHRAQRLRLRSRPQPTTTSPTGAKTTARWTTPMTMMSAGFTCSVNGT